jgi:hypothetical protein
VTTIQALVLDARWEAIELLLLHRYAVIGGRPRIDDRAALAGIGYQTAPRAAGRTRPLGPTRLVGVSLDSLSARQAGGELTGPNPTDAAATWL